MALAVIQYQGTQGGQHQFKADIGTNHFFQYLIGGRRQKHRGLERVEEISYQSPVFAMRNGGKALMKTRFPLAIPERLFDRQQSFVQLVSFKDKQGRGRALSNIIRVMPTAHSAAYSMSLEIKNMEHISVKNKAFCYREPRLSQGMFIDSIISTLPNVIGPIVNSLVNKGSSSNGTSQIVGAVADLLKKVSSPPPPPTPLKPAKGVGKPQTAAGKMSAAISKAQSTEGMAAGTWTKLRPLLEKIISPETLETIVDHPEKVLRTISDALLKELNQLKKKTAASTLTGGGKMAVSKSLAPSYSEAKAFPLLAALPVLAPLVKDLLNTGLKQEQEQNRHLEALNPGVDADTESNERILASMSLAALTGPKLPFATNPKLDIEFVQVNTVELQGKSRVVYKKQDDLYFPVKVSTQAPNPPKRPIPKVIVQLIVQDGENMEVLVEKKFRLRDVAIGSTLPDIHLTQEEAANLPVNKDLKIEVSFIWRGAKSGRNHGTFKNHFITLIDDYIFDRIGNQIGDPVALNDIVKHRAFWHKVWEGSGQNGRRWNTDFEVKYYYALDFDEAGVSRLETRQQILEDNAVQEQDPSRRRVSAKLKSGLELSLDALNKLLPGMSKPALPEAQLRALKSPELQKSYHLSARINLEMKGKNGETGTIWAYPEMSLHQLHLVGPSEVNDLGQVVALNEVVVSFFRPSSIHFIGTKSQ